ncbi:hypothetical protein [Clostridium formicaceticum]|uniref:Uncharacterized protein n=1 Tax=Clostridium formicaceticum TaxID=1497 RepID=A0AAC9WI13_9CLOT|nr:hypothetical protein [Clostridium formicaceticum]ARE89309.1 hypothetical protein CLFO_37160 [Clostridium formicaceticum]
MEIWKANLIESIKKIENAKDDARLSEDKYNELTEVIVRIQNIIED